MEEYVIEAMLARDTEIMYTTKEVTKEAVVSFKYSKELATLLKKKYEAGHEAGYNARVEEILNNIWLKHQDIDYRFLGEEFKKLIGQWLENERLGILKNAPPPSPLSPATEGNVIATEVGSFVVQEQQPPIDVKKGEVAASYPSPTIEEPANEVTFGLMGNHDLIYSLWKRTCDFVLC